MTHYIPTIEEFHVGFEYEFKAYNGWIHRTTDVLDFTPTYANPDDLVVKLAEGRIRVKHLDKADWLSLGFEDGSKYGFTNMVYTDEDGEQGQVEFQESNRYTMIVNFDGFYVFQGFIKNKSELKKTLQQLQIPFNNE